MRNSAETNKQTNSDEIKKKCSEATQTLHAGCSKADTQTNTQTDRGDYNTLRSLARSVNITPLALVIIIIIIYFINIMQIIHFNM